MGRREASRRVAEQQAADENNPRVPLGDVQVRGDTDNWYVTLPLPTADRVGLERGQALRVLYNPETDAFEYKPKE